VTLADHPNDQEAAWNETRLQKKTWRFYLEIVGEKALGSTLQISIRRKGLGVKPSNFD
jgi:hypothetical protein